MKLYQIDLTIYATAYIRAVNAESVKSAAAHLNGLTLEVKDAGGEIPISDDSYDSPDLPDVSLSPAMTVSTPVGTVHEAGK